MRLHSSKRNALLQLINYLPSCDIDKIVQLYDGKLFCNIIKNVFLETGHEIPFLIKHENLSCDDSFGIKSEDEKMICEDSKTESEDAKEKISDSGLTKSSVSDIDSNIAAAESVPKSENIDKDDESDVKNEKSVIKSPKSTKHNSKSPVEPVKSSGGDNEHFIGLFKFADSDDISKRYKFIKYFIDVKYNLQSDTVISYPDCIKKSEFELAKVAVFILSEVVQYYVLINHTIIHGLSLLDIKVQQELEQCFSFFINERSNITKKEIEKLLSNPSPNKTSPNKSYFATPRRSCSSMYKRSLSPSQEIVYTDSPLKAYFESPVFTKLDIISKDKEIFKMRENLFKEETKCDDLQVKVDDLEKELNEKEKEIKSLKSRCRELQETVNENFFKKENSPQIKPEKCRNCEKFEENINELENKLVEVRKKNNRELYDTVYHLIDQKQEEYRKLLEECKKEAAKAEEEYRALEQVLDKKKVVIAMKEYEIAELKRDNKENIAQLQLLKEKLAYLNRTKNDEESLEFGECMGIYMNDHQNSSESEVKSDLEEKIMHHVMVQCPEQDSEDSSIQNESERSVPAELPASDFCAAEGMDKGRFKNQNLSICPQIVTNEFSFNCDISNEKNAISKPCTDSPNKVPSPENSHSAIKTDGFGSLWDQHNSSVRENENADEVFSTDNSTTKPELSQLLKRLLVIIKSSSEPNGSNGFVVLPVLNECLEELKKMCLSESGESQVKFQNNNSVSKKFIDEEEHNSDSVSSKNIECLKVESDVPNKSLDSTSKSSTALPNKSLDSTNKSSTALPTNLDSTTLPKEQEQQTISKEQHKIVVASLQEKVKQLQLKELQLNRKYLSYKNKTQEMLEVLRNLEMKCQKLQTEVNESKKREIGKKRELKTEMFQLKTEIYRLQKQIDEELKKTGKLEKSVAFYKAKNKEVTEKLEYIMEKNKKLEDDRTSYKTEIEQLLLRVKDLEKKLEDSNCNFTVNKLSGASDITVEIKSLPNMKDASKEDTPSECTVDDSPKSKVILPKEIDTISLDKGNESTLSGALGSKSALLYFNDDEESFLNHSSIAEIKKDYESQDVQNNIRLQELKRRNTMLPGHLQSCYPAEGVVMTPSHKKSSKLSKNRKSEAMKFASKLGKNGQLGIKRKFSDIQTLTPSSKLSAARMKIKKSLCIEQEITPKGLANILKYHRKERSGVIKPEP